MVCRVYVDMYVDLYEMGVMRYVGSGLGCDW